MASRMKLTLDHNVLIDLANGSVNVANLRQVLASGTCQAYVVEIGASEMRQKGIRPDRYDLFEELLDQIGLGALPRLMPIMIWDVTFWDHGLWADAAKAALAAEIEQVLFGGSAPLDIQVEPDTSPKFSAWLNRVCDIHSMWCHIHYANDVFVTSDRNFHKLTKLPKLLAMGAGRICRPEDL
jgi:hypothetical protein